MTPAAAPSRWTANAVTGVGNGAGISRASKPAAAKICAESSAKSADPCRASNPTTTGRPVYPCSASQLARPAAARRTTVRFIPFGPARNGPRSPAVPKVSGTREPVGELGVGAGVEQLLQLGRGGRVDVVGDPGLDLGAGHERT